MLSNNVRRRRRGRTKNMIKVCKSCGKEFQNFTEGVLYSSHAIGVLEFCSDDCSKNYFNSGMK
jgi:transposase-like protein